MIITSQHEEATTTLRTRKYSMDDVSIDTCSTASLSDRSSSDDTSSSSCSESTATTQPSKNRRRRRRGRKTSTKSPQQQQQQNKQPELSETEKAQYLAMDCEMVGTGYYGHVSTLARVTLLDWDGQVVYDAYVSQTCEITDYRTHVSGITPQHLMDNGQDFCLVRQQVANLVQGKIVVGHALKNDFQALGLTHPWQQTRDTAKYEPFMQQTDSTSNRLWPRKLKDLAQTKLQRDIQRPDQSHCPIEDALAALDLYKKVRSKWDKAMEYKMQRTAEIVAQQQQR